MPQNLSAISNGKAQKASSILGSDLKSLYRIRDGRHEDVDLDVYERPAPGRRILTGLEPVSGIDNAVQAVIHRIKTIKGELADLGHPDYGSEHHRLIGEPNSENNRNLVKVYILQALSREPRIGKIHKAWIDFVPGRDRDKVNINLILSFIGIQAPQNLVIPFSFSEKL